MPVKCKIETFRQMLGNVECETAIVVLNVIAISGILIIVTLFAVLTKIRFVNFVSASVLDVDSNMQTNVLPP